MTTQREGYAAGIAATGDTCLAVHGPVLGVEPELYSSPEAARQSVAHITDYRRDFLVVKYVREIRAGKRVIRYEIIGDERVTGTTADQVPWTMIRNGAAITLTVDNEHGWKDASQAADEFRSLVALLDGE